MDSKLIDILKYCTEHKGSTVKDLVDYSMNNNLNWEVTINDYIFLIKEYLASDEELIFED